MDTRASTRGQYALFVTAGLLLLWSITACTPAMMSHPGAGPMPGQMAAGPNPPLLEDIFAASAVPRGGVWNVFVKGSDPDGDMSHLWVIVSQLGKRSESETIALKGSDQRAFSGYFTIYPRGANFSPWEDLRVTVRIRDRAGHLSETREVETRLGFQTREMLPAKWADSARYWLGTILFDLAGDNGDPEVGRRSR